MLIICNGAIKSGSTWLYNILVHLVDCKHPPEHYLTENSRKKLSNPCIRPDLLEKFLETEDIVSNNFISKNHLGKEAHRELLKNNNHVFVFDIERNIRDVVVSAYYDARNRHGYDGSFRDYYWNSGRYIADSVIRYHAVWMEAGPGCCIVSYESLHADFNSEVAKIGKTLGLDLSESRLDQLREATSLKQLRKNYQDQPLYKGDRFFRKGTTGDWENHFDPGMIRDIDRIEDRGIGMFDLHRLLKQAGGLLGRQR